MICSFLDLIFAIWQNYLTYCHDFSPRREDSELGDGPDSRLSNYSNVSELVRAKQLEAVQLRFNLEAASLLPLVLR